MKPQWVSHFELGSGFRFVLCKMRVSITIITMYETSITISTHVRRTINTNHWTGYTLNFALSRTAVKNLKKKEKKSKTKRSSMHKRSPLRMLFVSSALVQICIVHCCCMFEMMLLPCHRSIFLIIILEIRKFYAIITLWCLHEHLNNHSILSNGMKIKFNHISSFICDTIYSRCSMLNFHRTDIIPFN